MKTLSINYVYTCKKSGSNKLLYNYALFVQLDNGKSYYIGNYKDLVNYFYDLEEIIKDRALTNYNINFSKIKTFPCRG